MSKTPEQEPITRLEFYLQGVSVKGWGGDALSLHRAAIKNTRKKAYAECEEIATHHSEICGVSFSRRSTARDIASKIKEKGEAI